MMMDLAKMLAFINGEENYHTNLQYLNVKRCLCIFDLCNVLSIRDGKTVATRKRFVA